MEPSRNLTGSVVVAIDSLRDVNAIAVKARDKMRTELDRLLGPDVYEADEVKEGSSSLIDVLIANIELNSRLVRQIMEQCVRLNNLDSDGCNAQMKRK